MWHMLAFEKASAGGVTLEDVPGIQDDIVALNQSNHYLLPQNMGVRFAYVLNPNATAAQISTPHFRTVALPAIEPQDIGTLPTSLPAIDWKGSPYPQVFQNDELTMLQTDTAVGAIQKAGIIGVLADTNMNIGQAEIYTLRMTSSNTTAAKLWTTVTMAFDQTIAVGTYQVVGMDCIAAHCVAARLIFPGGGWRPGCLGRATEATKPDNHFRYGRLGIWGTFTNTAPPSVQFLGDGTALTTQVVTLDVIKIA